MKKLLFALLAVAVSPPLFAQVSGTITSSQLVCIGVSADHSTVGVQVTGTWTGTLQPQVAIQGQPLTNSQVVPSTSTTPAATITANGVYYANVGSASQFCILGNTVSSGSAVVFLNAAKGVNASTLGGGGAGSGTVTNTGGNLTANAVVLGAGGADTKVSTGITSNGASEVDLGLNGTASGVLGLNGSTSGKATITAPAVAGTDTNPLSFSNGIRLPQTSTSCATPYLSFVTQTTSGFFQNGASATVVCGAGAADWGFAPSGQGSAFFAANNMGIGFSSSNTQASIPDTVFWRLAANVMQQGTDTANDETGLMRNGSPCRITADVSLTVNTANSFCSWSLPASAKPWAFRCDIQWAITAGSGTNTFALGVNASQTPTGTTNAEAQVYTATAGTQTMGSAAIGASGAINVLTGATYTPGATVQAAKISGTLLASGTAGTFAITAAANGTTATAAVKAGSACWLN